mmetsp:Transcript_18850/g.49993  ORF Transcript_18850/g.49993 Transcript_18850/m.49993 type:complete len:221 (+) Transcript_18850:538-1200(+)
MNSLMSSRELPVRGGSSDAGIVIQSLCKASLTACRSVPENAQRLFTKSLACRETVSHLGPSVESLQSPDLYRFAKACPKSFLPTFSSRSLNGLSPVKRMHSMIPHDQESTFVSAAVILNTSGAKYCESQPQYKIRSSSRTALSISSWYPKSETLAITPLFVSSIKMFDGFRFRWVTMLPCKAFRPSKTCDMTSRINFSLTSVLCEKKSKMLPSFMYSMTM